MAKAGPSSGGDGSGSVLGSLLEENAGPADVDLNTWLEYDKFTFAWTVSTFEEPSGTLNKIWSPLFIGGAKSQHSWQLMLCPKEMHLGNEYTTIHLVLREFGPGSDSPDRKVRARLQISVSIQSAESPIKFLDSVNALEFRKNYGRGWYQSLLSTEMQGILANNPIQFHCTVWIERDIQHGVKEFLGFPAQEKLEREGAVALANDFSQMFKESGATDVSISVDGRETPVLAHKFVLKARSPVFAQMFRADPLKDSVSITGFDSATVEGLLEWMYCGKTKRLLELAPHLLQIAEKFQCADLKGRCENVLAVHLSVENVARITVLAHYHRVPKLKRFAMEFFIKNKQEVLKTVDFKELTQTYGSCVEFRELFVQSIWE